MNVDEVELSAAEIVQTIITISTALIVAREITPAEAAALAVDIIEAAATHVDAARMMLDITPPPPVRRPGA